MAEWVLDGPVAVAPELVLQRHDHFGSRGQRGSEYLVCVFDVHMQGYAGADLGSCRCQHAHLRNFVVEHQDGVADLDFGMDDFAVRCLGYAPDLSAKGLLVELGGLLRITDEYVRGEGV